LVDLPSNEKTVDSKCENIWNFGPWCHTAYITIKCDLLEKVLSECHSEHVAINIKYLTISKYRTCKTLGNFECVSLEVQIII